MFMLNTVTRDKKILFTPLPPQDSCERFQFNKLFYETHIFFSVSQCAAFKVNAVNSAFVSLKPEPESEISTIFIMVPPLLARSRQETEKGSCDQGYTHQLLKEIGS